MNRPLRQGLIVATFACVAYIVLLGPSGYLDQRTHLREIEALRAQNELLAQQNEKLRGNIDDLQHDKAYIEKLAREMLGLQYPGERPLRIVQVGDTAAPATR